jgi:cytoskeleton protein RodZ
MSDTVGQLLRATREAKGQTLDDVERVIRIRAKHLAALEADQFAALPSTAHARGFLKNYSQHLGLDTATVLAAYDAQVQKRSLLPRLKPAVPPRPIQSPAPRPRAGPSLPAANPARPARAGLQGRPAPVRVRRPRLLSADVLVAVIITLALGTLLFWGAQQLATGAAAGAGTATPTLSLLAGLNTPDPAAATAAALASLEAGPPTERPSPTPTDLPTPAVPYSGVNLTVSAELRSWVSVRVDGVEVFAGILPPGETREFVGLSVVEVTTGNGQGTRVIFNGVDQGLLGELGEVVTRLWTESGMVIPTPTAAPTTEG